MPKCATHKIEEIPLRVTRVVCPECEAEQRKVTRQQASAANGRLGGRPKAGDEPRAK